MACRPVRHFAAVRKVALQLDVKAPVLDRIPFIPGKRIRLFRIDSEFLLQKLLLRRSALSPRFSIVLVSVLFAGMHLFNLRSGMAVPVVLLQAGCAFCFSMWAGAVVWRTHSVMIPLLAHILLNLTAFEGGGAFLPLAASLITLLDGLFLMAEPSKL